MQKKTYRIRINQGELEYNLSREDLDELDIVSEGEGAFHILHEKKAYQLKVLAADYEQKIFKLKINGSVYHIEIADHFDLLVEKLGLNQAITTQVKYVKAPMPGMILDIAVNNGQPVTKGDQLLVLEAMKMENIIKSPGDGIVKAVMVAKGKTVEKGTLLIEME